MSIQCPGYKVVEETPPEETEDDGAGEQEVEESDLHLSNPEGEAEAKWSFKSPRDVNQFCDELIEGKSMGCD